MVVKGVSPRCGAKMPEWSLYGGGAEDFNGSGGGGPVVVAAPPPFSFRASGGLTLLRQHVAEAVAGQLLLCLFQLLSAGEGAGHYAVPGFAADGADFDACTLSE